VAVDPELAAMMLDVAVYKPRASLNGYGEDSFGAAVTVVCRVESELRMVRNMEGQEVVSGTTIYTDRIYGIAVSGQLTLPDGRIPHIISVATHRDDVGDSHEVVYVA